MDWIATHFNTAKYFGSISKDPSSKCGTIAVTEDNRLLSQGWNGFPRGVADTAERLENREVKYGLVVHSEQNCIYNAAYSGVSLKGSFFFTHAPIHVCNDCAKGIIQSGVKQAYMCVDPTRADAWLEKFEITKVLFKEAKLPYRVYKEFADDYGLIESG